MYVINQGVYEFAVVSEEEKCSLKVVDYYVLNTMCMLLQGMHSLASLTD